MIKNNINKSLLDIREQNISLIAFAISFLLIILLKIFLQKINLNPFIDYVALLCASGIGILGLVYYLSQLSDRFLTNKSLAIGLHTIAWLCLIFLAFFYIDYAIYYKWNPEKAVIYANMHTYILAILVTIITYYYQLLTKKVALKKLFNYFCITGAALISLYLASFLIINDYHLYYTNAIHMDVVIYPIAQVFLGKVLMVDFAAQYGAYAHFMEPILQLTGLSLVSITSLFSLLMFISLFMVAVALYKLLDNKLLAIIGFISFLYAIITTFMLFPYQLLYQIYPIRLIFPAYALLAAVFYFKQPTTKSFLIHIAVLSLGVLWNIDKGIIALASFSAASLFPTLCRSQLTILQKGMLTLRDVLLICIVFVAIMYLYSLYINTRYAVWPDLYQLFVSFEYFSETNSIKDYPLNKTCLFGIFVYLMAFVYVGKHLLKQQAEYITYIIFFLLVLGLGVMVRHVFNHEDNGELYATYPAILILVIFTDKYLLSLQQHAKHFTSSIKDKLLLWSNYVFLVVIISFFAYVSIFFLYHNNSHLFQNAVRINEFSPIASDNNKLAWFYGNEGDTYTSYVQMQDIARDNSIESPWQERARKLKIFYNENNLDNKTIAIFSMWDGYLHMKLKHPSPLPIINSQHVHINRDWDILLHLISTKAIDIIIIDESFFRDVPRFDEWQDVIPAIEEHYKNILSIPLQPSWNYLKSKWQKTQLTVFHRNNVNIEVIKPNYL